MICVPSLVSIIVSMVLVSLPAFICQPARNPVSQMSQCFSCHGSAHKCLFVSLSSLQTQVLHRPVNGFVRWPFHRASHEDRQRTAISLSVCVSVCVWTCVCFSHRHQEISSGNKWPPKYPPQWCISKIPLSYFPVRQQSVIQPAIMLNNLAHMSFYRTISSGKILKYSLNKPTSSKSKFTCLQHAATMPLTNVYTHKHRLACLHTMSLLYQFYSLL